MHFATALDDRTAHSECLHEAFIERYVACMDQLIVHSDANQLSAPERIYIFGYGCEVDVMMIMCVANPTTKVSSK